MEELEKLKVGVLFDKRQEDYQLGSSPVIKEELMPDLDWKKWTPEHEKQAYRYFDTMSCVSYSATDAIEYQFTYALNNGKISAEDSLWLTQNGYFKNGLINFSERFTAILGETTINGAYQYKVGDAIRKFGLIPQDMFPTNDDIKSFDEYLDKGKITKEMYDLGAEFIKRFPISYEWVGSPEDLKTALKYAPVQVCVYYLDYPTGDTSGVLCTDKKPIHAVLAVNIEDTFVEIDDSYTRQFKKYCYKGIWSPMLYSVNFKNNNNDMVYLKTSTSPHIYAVDKEKKTKLMVIDMPTLNALGGLVQIVDSLDNYKTLGTLVFLDRIIE